MTKEQKRMKRLKSIKNFREFGIKKYGSDFFNIYSNYQSIKQRLKNDFGFFVDTFKDKDGKFCEAYTEKYVNPINNKKYSVSSWVHYSQKLIYLFLQSIVFDNLDDDEFLVLIAETSALLELGRHIEGQVRVDTTILRAIFNDYLTEFIELRYLTKNYK